MGHPTATASGGRAPADAGDAGYAPWSRGGRTVIRSLGSDVGAPWLRGTPPGPACGRDATNGRPAPVGRCPPDGRWPRDDPAGR